MSDNSCLFRSIKKKTQAKKNKDTGNNPANDSNEPNHVRRYFSGNIFPLLNKKVIGAARMLLTISRKVCLWLQPPYLTSFLNIEWFILFDFNRISKTFYCIIIFKQPVKFLRLLLGRFIKLVRFILIFGLFPIFWKKVLVIKKSALDWSLGELYKRITDSAIFAA